MFRRAKEYRVVQDGPKSFLVQVRGLLGWRYVETTSFGSGVEDYDTLKEAESAVRCLQAGPFRPRVVG